MVAFGNSPERDFVEFAACHVVHVMIGLIIDRQEGAFNIDDFQEPIRKESVIIRRRTGRGGWGHALRR